MNLPDGLLCVGDRFQTKSGDWYTILEIGGSRDIKIKFDDGFEKTVQKCNMISGSIRLPKIREGQVYTDRLGEPVLLVKLDKGRATFRWEDGYERTQQTSAITLGSIMREADSSRLNPNIGVGKRFKMNAGSELEVIEKLPKGKFKVKFLDQYGYETIVYGSNIVSGNVHNKYLPTVFGVGVIGDSDVDISSKCYSSWTSMLKRCYSGTIETKAYHDCSVTAEWFHFKNFEEWFETQVVHTGWELDKDLLVKGNKVYSASTCLFLPTEINCFLTKRYNHRGKWPIGVTYHERLNKWEASCSNVFGKKAYLGVFEDPHTAFLAYKEAKENYAKMLADKWSTLLDARAVEALRNFRVDLTD